MPSVRYATRRPNRHALTLVELLVAAALAAMLLTTTMGILKTLVAKRKVLVDGSALAAWHRPLEDQLRWDLANARRYEFNAQRLRLVGYGARDFDTHVATHRQSEVVYQVVRLAQNSWLWREEIQPEINSNRNRRREIVCCGVTGLAMQIPGQAGEPQHAGPIPDHFRLLLTRDNASQPLIDILSCR